MAGNNQEIVLALLDNEAHKRGYDDHIFAYMSFKSGPDNKPTVVNKTAVKRKPRKKRGSTKKEK